MPTEKMLTASTTRPPYTKDEKKECKKRLTTLLKRFGGNKNRMARELGFTRNAVSWWFTKGYIGAFAAIEISDRPDSNLTLEMLRPDIVSRRKEVEAKLDKLPAAV